MGKRKSKRSVATVSVSDGMGIQTGIVPMSVLVYANLTNQRVLSIPARRYRRRIF